MLVGSAIPEGALSAIEQDRSMSYLHKNCESPVRQGRYRESHKPPGFLALRLATAASRCKLALSAAVTNLLPIPQSLSQPRHSSGSERYREGFRYHSIHTSSSLSPSDFCTFNLHLWQIRFALLFNMMLCHAKEKMSDNKDRQANRMHHEKEPCLYTREKR